MASARIDGLSPAEREQLVAKFYGRELITTDQITDRVSKAIASGEGLSLVRVGDVVSSLLCERYDAIQIWSFLGIPKPPTPAFMAELRAAVDGAHILGLTHRRPFAQWLSKYLHQHGITPPAVTESFVNDSLFAQGHLHRLIRSHRVALVGRAAQEGARRLAEAGLPVALAEPLEAYDELPLALSHLQIKSSQFDLALVGAGIAGRLLCVELAKGSHKVALDVGHVLDGIVHPETWEQPDRRRRIRQAYAARSRQRKGDSR